MITSINENEKDEEQGQEKRDVEEEEEEKMGEVGKRGVERKISTRREERKETQEKICEQGNGTAPEYS